MVMFSRAWCKKYVHSLRCGSTIDGYRVFLSGCGGSGKSHCVSLTQRDMSYFLRQVVNAVWIVLVTAPTGSAAFQIVELQYILHFCCIKDQQGSQVGRSEL